MFWKSQDELDALAQFRADRRRNEELHQELMDFTDIFFDSKDPRQKGLGQTDDQLRQARARSTQTPDQPLTTTHSTSQGVLF